MEKFEKGVSCYINPDVKSLDDVVNNIYVGILRDINKPGLPIKTSIKIKEILSNPMYSSKKVTPELLIYDQMDLDEDPYEVASRKVCKDLNLNFLHFGSFEFMEKLTFNGIDSGDFIFSFVDLNDSHDYSDSITVKRASLSDVSSTFKSISLPEASARAGGTCIVIKNAMNINNIGIMSMLVSQIDTNNKVQKFKNIHGFFGLSQNSSVNKSSLGFNINKSFGTVLNNRLNFILVEKDPNLSLNHKKILNKRNETKPSSVHKPHSDLSS